VNSRKYNKQIKQTCSKEIFSSVTRRSTGNFPIISPQTQTTWVNLLSEAREHVSGPLSKNEFGLDVRINEAIISGQLRNIQVALSILKKHFFSAFTTQHVTPVITYRNQWYSRHCPSKLKSHCCATPGVRQDLALPDGVCMDSSAWPCVVSSDPRIAP
jgi:hypothetical protein